MKKLLTCVWRSAATCYRFCARSNASGASVGAFTKPGVAKPVEELEEFVGTSAKKDVDASLTTAGPS